MDITTNKFGKLATESNNFQSSPRLLCHRGTFYKRLKQYQIDGVIPNDNDFDMKVGAQPIILKENIQNWNDTLKDCKGYTKNNADPKEPIVTVSDGNKQKQGDYGYTKTPCTETIQFY